MLLKKKRNNKYLIKDINYWKNRKKSNYYNKYNQNNLHQKQIMIKQMKKSKHKGTSNKSYNSSIKCEKR